MNNLNRNLSIDEIEDEYVHAIFTIEHELGHYIDEDYPLTKFWEEIKELEWYNKKQEEAKNHF